jgi:hypothetical protein
MSLTNNIKIEIMATNSHMNAKEITAIVLSGFVRLGDNLIINPIAAKKSPTIIIT